MARKTRAGEEQTRSFTYTWRNRWLTPNATTLDEMAAMLQEVAQELLAMSDAGVILDPEGMGDDYAILSTTDPEVAERFQFDEEDLAEDDHDHRPS